VPSVSGPWSLRLARARGGCSSVCASFFRQPPPHRPYRRTDGASDPWGVQSPRVSTSAPGVSRRASGLRLRLATAGFHARRRGRCAWFLFFPRSVGFGPTASRASGALTIAPSILCQTHAIPSISSYSARPRRHIRTKTPRRFHVRKYLCTELALPNFSGKAFHWHPVRSTYTIASNTLRGSKGLRPPPGRRLYFRPFGRRAFGIRGATRSHNASDTVHDLIALMNLSIEQITYKRKHYLRISSKYKIKCYAS